MAESLKKVLMRRDGLTSEEADEQIMSAKERFDEMIMDGEDPSDLMMEEFGLEPDYLEEFY